MNSTGWFKALGNETRLRILNLTLSQELNVQELMSIMGMGQSRISRHLKILADGGLLTYRRDGLWVFYRAAEQGPGRRFLDSISNVFAENGTFAADRARAADVLAVGRRATKRFFDKVAAEWDQLKQNIVGETDLNAEILKRLPECAVAVDLGCGTGALLAALASRARTVIGVDSSPLMLEQARHRCAGYADSIQMRIGELEHLPMRDAEADCAALNLVLHHLRSPLEGLREARRVLKPGGWLILVDLMKHTDENFRRRFGDRWLGFAPEELQSWLQEAGFVVQECAELPLRQGLTAVLLAGKKV